MAVEVIKELCRGCALCIKACPFEAIDMVDQKAVINEKCTSCNQCIPACPFDAIEAKEQEAAADLDAYQHVWVFGEIRDGTLAGVSKELIGEGKRLAGELGDASKIYALLVGEDVEGLSQTCFEYGADGVILMEHPLLKHYTTDAYTKVIVDAIGVHKPEIVLYGATHVGRDLAPRVAARLNTGLTADCTRLDVDIKTYIEYAKKETTLDVASLDPEDQDRGLKQTRPAFGGNLMATIVCPRTRPQMATVRPGVMQKRERLVGAQGEVIRYEPQLAASDIRTEVLEVVKTARERVSLTDANIICSGGRGLGDPQGFDLIKQLADKVGGVVGSSRAAVDAGWIEHAHQVGQTGTTVKPNIYFACGISGAIQHLAGMQKSDIIVAINKDPDAPIFGVADYGIVGDLYKVIPQIIDSWDKADELVTRS